VRGLTNVLSENQNVSAAVSPADAIVKTEPVDTEPSAHDEAVMSRDVCY